MPTQGFLYPVRFTLGFLGRNKDSSRRRDPGPEEGKNPLTRRTPPGTIKHGVRGYEKEGYRCRLGFVGKGLRSGDSEWDLRE